MVIFLLFLAYGNFNICNNKSLNSRTFVYMIILCSLEVKDRLEILIYLSKYNRLSCISINFNIYLSINVYMYILFIFTQLIIMFVLASS